MITAFKYSIIITLLLLPFNAKSQDKNNKAVVDCITMNVQEFFFEIERIKPDSEGKKQVSV